jgi:DNA replication protein DnaC
MNSDTVYQQLREMKLSHMAAQLQQRLANGDNRDLSHEQFIAMLVEDEYLHRRQNRLNRMIARAGFKPEQPAVEHITYGGSRGLQKQDFAVFSSPRWIDDAHNVIFTGPTGCGKSFLAQALALQACRMGYPSRYIRYTMLCEEINAARGTGLYLKFLKKMAKTKILIIDDFVMQEVAAHDLSSIMDVIEEKQQTGSIIITTQYPIAKWHHRMPDPTVADAICDRLTANAYIFNLKGGDTSMRKQTTHKSHAK